MGATKRERPRLHLVKGAKDQGLYCQDLDWFFGCYASECGLKSLGVSSPLDLLAALPMGKHKKVNEWGQAIEVTVYANSVGYRRDPDPYTDKHVNFGNSGVFTRGRKIWRRLKRLPWSVQEVLRCYYEPRQFGATALPESLVRAIHQMYREAE